SVEGKYLDTQDRLYWLDAETGEVQRWAADFEGAVGHYALLPSGDVLATARRATEVQLYSQAAPKAPFSLHPARPGTYARVSAAGRSPRIALVYSSFDQPMEVYLADSLDKVAQARPITAFNRLFTERDLPRAKPYQWTSDDGTHVEGMLVYPPGQFEAKNLPM